MRKRELIRDNQNLKNDVQCLNHDISKLKYEIEKYKELLTATRECYGYKILELENKRLLTEHPDVFADYIEWPSVVIGADVDYNTNYKIVYDLKRNILKKY